ILSGPSGGGKGTIRKEIFRPDTDLEYSMSMTTREIRAGEVVGVDYFLWIKEQFDEMMRQHELLEYASYVHNHYGTPKKYVEDALEAGYDVFLEIEVQGAKKVKENFPEGVFIFLFTPSLDELKNRIMNRGTETNDLVLNRLKEAR